MFLKYNLWKKLMNQAWKGEGLRVGNSGEDYIICGGWWLMGVRKEALKNKEKSAIIEMIGEFPETGEMIKAVKDEASQYEFGIMMDLIKILEGESRGEFYETKIVYHTGRKYLRVYQEVENNHCILMDNTISELIDIKSMDILEESPIEGPFGSEEGKCIIWKNNIMKFVAFKIAVAEGSQEKCVIKIVENMKLPAIGGRRKS